MRLKYEGELTIDAAYQDVWDFITTPERVGRCLPDLQELAVQDRHRFEATVRVGVGPVRGPFRLQVELAEEEPGAAASLRIRGAGMGSGLELASAVRLAPHGERATVVRWTAEGSVFGPLATVGGRILDSQARKTIEQLFDNIRRALAVPEAAAGSQ